MTERAPNRLPAKGARAGKTPVSLYEHSASVAKAARELFAADSRLLGCWLRFFKLGDQFVASFLRHLCCAAWLHDLGKANEDFVEAVTRPGFVPQSLRHEHLSALVLQLGAMRDWLLAGGIDIDIVTAAVLSHHIKAAQTDERYRWGQSSSKALVQLYLDHDEVWQMRRKCSVELGIAEPPALPQEPWQATGCWCDAWEQGTRAARVFRRDLRKNQERRQMTAAVKAALIAADSVGSAMLRTGTDLSRWIQQNAHQKPIGGYQVRHSILEPRALLIEETRGEPFRYHAFQEGAALLGRRALLLAGCGSGKTMAAWRWAATQLAKECCGHVIFLYPTRGTATEGFRDYIAWAPETEAALVHGTSRYELNAMQVNPRDSRAGKDFSLSEADAKLFALGLWSRRYISATVDQFLAFLEHSYTSLCLLPMLADSAVVIDEVHSFSRSMFDDLVAFLRDLDLPVLCMSATLPEQRRRQLQELGLSVYPTKQDRAELADLAEREQRPRYKLQVCSGPEATLAAAASLFQQGKRVLWVVNNVARCQQLADALEDRVGESVLCYHSRYRLKDRYRVHNKTVEAFKQSQYPALAVTTQVCEMSLDLDADVLITEQCPVPSLVQRMGRANRSEGRDPDFRAEVLVYAPPHHLPYTKEEIAACQQLIAEHKGQELSQHNLVAAMDKYSVAEADVEGACRLFEAGYYAMPGSIRDEDGYTTSCLRDADVERALDLLHQHEPIDGLVLSAPKKQTLQVENRPAKLPPYLGIVDSGLYCRRRGLRAKGASHGE